MIVSGAGRFSIGSEKENSAAAFLTSMSHGKQLTPSPPLCSGFLDIS